ncbi:Capsule polysaccharide biosynthesis protein [Pyrenophora tritici-repentis]|nr:Capsule polysaccharide biosynthesis protein [Pyrenophora tritici-repentis]
MPTWSQRNIINWEPNSGSDGVNYWANKVLLWDALSEDLPTENTIGFYGEDLLKAVAMKVESNENSTGYKKAESLISKMLAQRVLQKITHRKGLTHSLHCRTLLGMPENYVKDGDPVTFGELLR